MNRLLKSLTPASAWSQTLLVNARRPAQQLASIPTLTRAKSTRKLAPGARRVINLLSVISARRKQPRRLKLCKEDLVRHQVIQAAWSIFMRDEKAARVEKLQKQHAHIVEACDTLADLDPELFKAANEREKGKRFALEMRTPTDTPPREPWMFKWSPLEKKPSQE